MKSVLPFTLALLLSSILGLCSSHAFAMPTTLSGINVVTQKPETLKLDANPTTQNLVVIFLSAKCPCSNSHIDAIKALAKDFPATQFVAVHSNFDEDQATTEAYFKKVNLPFSVIQDVKGQYANQFHALKTPHAFVLNQKGDVLYQGGVSDSHEFKKSKHQYLREALNDLKKGQAVQTTQGRTLGCVITREDGNAW
jgi:hypothetical protein